VQRFVRKLRDYGYIEGENLRLQSRFAEGHDDRYPDRAFVCKISKLKTKSPRRGLGRGLLGGGGIKTLGSSSVDRSATSREFPQNSEKLFFSCTRQRRAGVRRNCIHPEAVLTHTYIFQLKGNS
jgi:hypothetical protein